MNFDITQFVNSFHLSSVFKLGILSLIVLFVVFLFVVRRQVISLNKIVIESFFGGFLSVISLLLLLLGISLFFAALVIL